MRSINGHEMKKVHVASIVIATLPYSTKYTYNQNTAVTVCQRGNNPRNSPRLCVYVCMCVCERREDGKNERKRELCVLVAAEERRSSSGTVACVSCVQYELVVKSEKRCRLRPLLIRSDNHFSRNHF